jgi:hypothetical protein
VRPYLKKERTPENLHTLLVVIPLQGSIHFSAIKTNVSETKASHLSVQRDGAGLALGADTIGPWEVSLAP